MNIDHRAAFERYVKTLRSNGIHPPSASIELMHLAFLGGAMWANEELTRSASAVIDRLTAQGSGR